MPIEIVGAFSSTFSANFGNTKASFFVNILQNQKVILYCK